MKDKYKNIYIINSSTGKVKYLFMMFISVFRKYWYRICTWKL